MATGAATDSSFGLNPDSNGVAGKAARTVQVTTQKSDGTLQTVDMEVVAITLPSGALVDFDVLARIEALIQKEVRLLGMLLAHMTDGSTEDVDDLIEQPDDGL